LTKESKKEIKLKTKEVNASVEKNKLMVTDVGRLVCNFMNENFENIKVIISDNLRNIYDALSSVFSVDETHPETLSHIQTLLKNEKAITDKKISKRGRAERCIQQLTSILSVMYKNISTSIDSIDKLRMDNSQKPSELNNLLLETEKQLIRFINNRITIGINQCYKTALDMVNNPAEYDLEEFNGGFRSQKNLPFTNLFWYKNGKTQVIQKNRTKKISAYYKDVYNRNATKNVSKNGLYRKRHRSRMVREKTPRFLHFLEKT